MFAYCNNNPGIFLDSEGEFALAISVIAWLFVDLVISFGFIIQLIEIYEENSRSINALKNAHEEDSDSDESSQVEDAGVSAPATPPNGNRNNKNDKNKKIESENNTPRNNQAQNKQARDAARRAGLDKYQREIFHREISGQGYTYQEMLEIAYEVRGLYSE